jgi:hypothetical protein
VKLHTAQPGIHFGIFLEAPSLLIRSRLNREVCPGANSIKFEFGIFLSGFQEDIRNFVLMSSVME